MVGCVTTTYYHDGMYVLFVLPLPIITMVCTGLLVYHYLLSRWYVLVAGIATAYCHEPMHWIFLCYHNLLSRSCVLVVCVTTTYCNGIKAHDCRHFVASLFPWYSVRQFSMRMCAWPVYLLSLHVAWIIHFKYEYWCFSLWIVFSVVIYCKSVEETR